MLTTGFNSHLKKDWLDQVVSWVAAGIHGKQLDQTIREHLHTGFNCPTSQSKARNMLLRVWDKLPDHIPPGFQQTAIELASRVPDHSKPIHWGMILSKYPFFAYVANQVGKLSKLNQQFTYAQMERRVIEQFGDAEFIKRSLRHALHTMVSLEVLSGHGKGVYSILAPIVITDKETRVWLLEAGIRAENTRSRSMNTVLHDAFWFPFNFTVQGYELSDQNRLETYSQADDVIVFIN